MRRDTPAFVLRTVPREGVPCAYVSRLARDGGWGVTWHAEQARRMRAETAQAQAERINALAAPRFRVEVVSA